MPNSLSLEPGALLAGKYRVERVLGEGGMGRVVLAHHVQLDERVAIKIPLPDALDNPEAVARFMREARAAVKIKSEHVARVSDVGTLDTGEPFIVMEYLEGRDLAAWVAERGALPVEQAVEFVLQACEALVEAHSLGIVHRDLKPANLFCVRRSDGVVAVKVLDFGISKLSVGPDTSMTKDGAVMGSPLYMSPEQMLSAREVDARSDIWAIGIILFELLTARRPFQADSLIGLGVQIAQAPAPALTSYRSDVPLGLERVVLRCLEKDRNRRYQNVAELAHALAEFGPKRARASVERISRVIQTAGLAATEPGTPLAQSAAESRTPGLVSASATLSAFGNTARANQRRKRTLALIGLGALGAAALGGAWLFSAQRPSEQFETIQSATPAPSPSLATTAHVPRSERALASGSAPVVVPVEPAADAPRGTASSHELSAPPSSLPFPPSASPERGKSAAPVMASRGESAAGPQRGHATAASPPKKPTPDCDPNFYFDAQGEKHFKPQCF